MIICGPYRWNFHTDLFKAKTGCSSSLSLSKSDEHDSNPDEKRKVELQCENAFTLARLLQFIYYDTCGFKAPDLIPTTENLTHPGFIGHSPAMALRAGVAARQFDDAIYETPLSKDNATSTDFGHDFHLDLYKLAIKYQFTNSKKCSEAILLLHLQKPSGISPLSDRYMASIPIYRPRRLFMGLSR